LPIIVMMIGMGSTSMVNGLSDEERYQSGYDHGCDDAQIEDVEDRYINQDEKGYSYHTSDFNQGYKDGFKECGLDNGVLIDNSETEIETVEQENNQAVYTNQDGRCPQITLIGDCKIGQSSNNALKANNDN